MFPDLTAALGNYISDPKNPHYNFILGYTYEGLGHTAAAASFYIRTTEFGFDDLLTYEALLRLGLCFERQGSRVFTTKGIFLRAISLMPTRPEGYFLLGRLYEMCKDWQESYTICTIGEQLIEESEEKLLTNVEYPGKSGLLFEKSVAAWWIGLWDESMVNFKKLEKDPTVQEIHRNISRNNIINLWGKVAWKAPILYNESLHEHLRIKFPGSSDIVQNYSQCYQDMFVLTMLNGKREGKFLEIGCADPYYGNNTALLEKQFGWTGISIDYDQNFINAFNEQRISKTICKDATKIDYANILEGDYDYLQLDCDPALITYQTLLKIPFETHRFAVITFEHDHYNDEHSQIRDKSRKYLQSQGYKLVVANIAPDNYNPYEDWWVHPSLVSRDMINKMIDTSDEPKRPDNYMLKRKPL
jgi:hypothetical protein